MAEHYDDEKETRYGFKDPFGSDGKKKESPEDLKNAEQAAGSTTGSSLPQHNKEVAALEPHGKGYRTGDRLPGIGGGLREILGRGIGVIKRNPKKTAGTIVGGGVIGGGVFLFSIVQGPLQFIHFAQLLQKFHLGENQDHGDGRTSKVLLYALAGDAERGRLGVVGNVFADSYEKKLADSGLRPAYDNRTGRFVGFVTDDSDIAEALRRQTGDGVEIKKVGDNNIKGSRGSPSLDKNSTFIDARGCDFGCRRGMIREVGRATATSKLASAVNSRLLIKRGGVDFHPLNKAKRKADESDFKKKILRQNAEETRDGAEAAGARVGAVDDSDGDGKPDSNQQAEGLPEDVDEAAEEGRSASDDEAGTGSSTSQIYKDVIVKAGSAALIVGTLCAAQDFGENVEDYKYTNNMLPMMRMGWKAISMGNQVMSGDDVSLDELSAYNELLHDEEAESGGQSWTNARTVRAELGKEATGPDLPEEAQLKNINDKPAFFDLLSKIPGLGTACDVTDAFFGLPIISDISGAVSDIVSGAANAALQTCCNTTVEDLAGRALAVVAGDTVNPYAKGAEYGNLANTGAFIASNDQAVANGGRPLENQEVTELKSLQKELDKIENSQKSFAARYFDIYDPSSFVSSLTINLADFKPTKSLVPSNILGTLSSAFSSILPLPSASAATSNEELYGMPKFGFSVDEQSDDRFEDPYQNAAWVEPRLDELSEKYEKCFGMKVTESGDSIAIESKDQSDTENGNTYKVAYNEDYEICREQTEELVRYRFYLTDAVTAISLACYEGDTNACSQIGIGSETPSGGESGSGEISGNAQELAKEIMQSGKITGDPRYMGQIEAIANGNDECHVNIHILRMLAGIARDGHTLFISSLNRFCTGVLTASGTASYHYREGGGHAIDVTSFDGGTTTGGNTASAKYLDVALKYLPNSGVGVGQFQASCGYTYDFPSGVSNFSDSCNHVHIQVPID